MLLNINVHILAFYSIFSSEHIMNNLTPAALI